MSRFIDPRGKTTYGLGVCARCNRKMSLDDLHPDGNSPGLMVCDEDSDGYDPYRLPFNPADANISLPFVRPDVPVEPPDGASNFPDTLRSERS